MNRLIGENNGFSWPRVRHTALNRKQVNATILEDFCTEIIFAEREQKLIHECNMVKIGSIWKPLILETQMAVPMFIQICRDAVGNETKPVGFGGLEYTANQFYMKFSNKGRPLKIHELHFFLNNFLATAEQMIEKWSKEEYALKIKDQATFERNIQFLFNTALGEACNIEYAKMQERKYPSTNLLEQFLDKLKTLSPTRRPEIVVKRGVIPLAPGGLSRECVEGMWTMLAQLPEEQWINMLRPPEARQVDFKVFRYLIFYSRFDGPKFNHFWDLGGAITFAFSMNSAAVLEFSSETPQLMIRKAKAKADQTAEVLPEPYASTPQCRFFGSYSEDNKEDKILRFW